MEYKILKGIVRFSMIFIFFFASILLLNEYTDTSVANQEHLSKMQMACNYYLILYIFIELYNFLMDK